MILPWRSWWASLYRGEIDARDGGLGCVSDRTLDGSLWTAGIAHCEERSCMIDHSTYFDLASRFGIWKQIMDKTGQTVNADAITSFKNNDVSEVPEAQPVDETRPRLKQPVWIDLTEE